jgi:hypothetical protein
VFSVFAYALLVLMVQLVRPVLILRQYAMAHFALVLKVIYPNLNYLNYYLNKDIMTIKLINSVRTAVMLV